MTTPNRRPLASLVRKLLPEALAARLQALVRDRRDNKNVALHAQRLAIWEKNAGSAGSLEINLQPGVKMEVYFDSALSRLIYLGGYEVSERYFLNAFLKPGDCFADIGANVGMFSLIASNRVGPNGKVFAFEPCSGTFQRLNANIALNGFNNIAAHQIALSEEDGELELTLSTDGHDAWNSLTRPGDGEKVSSETVLTKPWDGFAKQHDLIDKVAMMKIDVEGWEMHFLAGAEDALSLPGAPVLQVEFNDEALAGADTTGQQLYEKLVALGYRMFSYDWESGGLRDEPAREAYPYVNLIAAKNPDAIRRRLTDGYFPGQMH